jgi:hypothetical protein
MLGEDVDSGAVGSCPAMGSFVGASTGVSEGSCPTVGALVGVFAGTSVCWDEGDRDGALVGSVVMTGGDVGRCDRVKSLQTQAKKGNSLFASHTSASVKTRQQLVAPAHPSATHAASLFALFLTADETSLNGSHSLRSARTTKDSIA